MHEKNVIDAITLNVKQHGYLNSAIKKLDNYPWGLNLATEQNTPLVLFKLGLVSILGMGKAQFNYRYGTLIICFYKKQDNWSIILDQLILLIIKVLYSFNCLRLVGLIRILTGDITLYSIGSEPGYNTNYMVRKIILDYTINKMIIPILLPILEDSILEP